jgi:ferrochelatase
MTPKTGILISNLGTPDAPTFFPVRRYLKQFLSDPFVVNLPRWKWWPILNGLILNIRPFRSAHNYRKIWTKQGSPLLVYTQSITKKLEAQLPNTPITLGMRYANPSLKMALMALIEKGVTDIILLPLYPQYSITTTGSTETETRQCLQQLAPLIKLRCIQHYHDHPLYIEAIAQSIEQHWQTHGKPDVLVFSFHSLPLSVIDQGDPYLDQCESTVRRLVERLKLQPSEYIWCFQSRVGFEKWLGPSTQSVLTKLAAENAHIQVICPGFSVDCLETLEEINIMGQAHFLAHGKGTFSYIPCLNDSDSMIALTLALLSA